MCHVQGWFVQIIELYSSHWKVKWKQQNNYLASYIVMQHFWWLITPRKSFINAIKFFHWSYVNAIPINFINFNSLNSQHMSQIHQSKWTLLIIVELLVKFEVSYRIIFPFLWQKNRFIENQILCWAYLWKAKIIHDTIKRDLFIFKVMYLSRKIFKVTRSVIIITQSLNCQIFDWVIDY